jgi:hypothetical protein
MPLPLLLLPLLLLAPPLSALTATAPAWPQSHLSARTGFDPGRLPVYTPGMSLDRSELDRVLSLGRSVKIYTPHPPGDQTDNVVNRPDATSAPDPIAYPADADHTWLYGSLMAGLTTVRQLRQLEHLCDIVTHSALHVLETLVAEQWLRWMSYRHFPSIAMYRAVNSPSHFTSDPRNASLVMLNGNSSASRAYLSWEKSQRWSRSSPPPLHFTVLPRPDSVKTMNHLLENPTNCVYVGNTWDTQDISVPLPYVLHVLPGNNRSLAEVGHIYTNGTDSAARPHLLSFMGSIYRAKSHAHDLESSRGTLLEAIADVQDRFANGSWKSLRHPKLRRFGEQHPAGLPAGLQTLFNAPSSNFNQSHPGLRRLAVKFFRGVNVEKDGKEVDNWDMVNGLNMLLVYGVYLSSVFCFQPPGDSVDRMGFYDSLLLGCVPVIYDYSVATYADQMFGGLLARTLHNLEDVAVVLNSDRLKAEPEYMFRVLLEMYVSGEAVKRQARLAEWAKLLVLRQDASVQDDVLTVTFGVLAEMKRRRDEGLVMQPQQHVFWFGKAAAMPAVDLTGVCEAGDVGSC